MTGAAPSGTPRRRRVTVVTTVVAVMAVYVGSLFGYALLEPRPRNFEFSEPSVTGESVVIVRLRQMDAIQNRLAVDVLIHPGPNLQEYEPADFTVRLSSWTASGELIYVHGDLSVSESATHLVAVGDPDDWPFDKFTTDTIGVEAFAGYGAEQRRIPAGIVAAGQINGWDFRAQNGTIDSAPDPIPTVRFTMERTRGALAFDVGVLLVLLALPAAALFVAIETVLGRRKFLPPLTTWFAAMLFAVVPLRNLLPGAPPAGAWIDLAVVLWVLIALAAAMVLYVVAWWRQRD
ncbi:DUF4436 family protein [Mycobacterium sp. 852014-52144_SCH5372336]|uniref:DUF4436 family protein n=1 Tax=Mycobacterium sp. 852014-52144_SCH5372336 TaxID=1834115 RepID=UPI0007FF7224|nr:DUF4436 family protein [Mycobacterium sp. 852014-52144_SCH5372336]OBB73895.1 DUF4436 domain-containing protein [Mycobacterium sp. 852014-52144_SCH5372336]